LRPGWSRRPAHKGLAAVVAISGSLLISSTAPALLEGAGYSRTDIYRGEKSGWNAYGVSFAGDSRRPTAVYETCRAIEESCRCAETDATRLARERLCPRPHGSIEYRGVPADTGGRPVELSDDVIPSTVRSKIADNQLFANLSEVDATAGDNDDAPAAAPGPARVSKLTKLSAARIPRHRATPTLRVVGCARCGVQVAQSSPGRAKSFILMSFLDTARAARSPRREHPPSGVARQREAPRVAGWILRRG
jgi:hypothetical protein